MYKDKFFIAVAWLRKIINLSDTTTVIVQQKKKTSKNFVTRKKFFLTYWFNLLKLWYRHAHTHAHRVQIT